MSQERSVRFSGKLRRVCAGLGAVAGLGAAIAIVATGGHAPQPMPSELPSSASPTAAPVATSDSTPKRRPPRSPEMRAVRRESPAAARVASRAPAPRSTSEERARLVETAHRELALLEVQEPKNFLALFDLMREDAPGQDKTLQAGRSASHAYILARMTILERMLRRFIDDPDSDRTLESDALASLDADFKQTIDSLARDVPSMASVQEILTTTMLKAPAFTDPGPEAE